MARLRHQHTIDKNANLNMTTQTVTKRDQKSSWKFAGFFIQNMKTYLTIKNMLE
jgi:hypothetical protein